MSIIREHLVSEAFALVLLKLIVITILHPVFKIITKKAENSYNTKTIIWKVLLRNAKDWEWYVDCEID